MFGKFLKKDKNSSIIIFFAGWGIDSKPFERLTTDKKDLFFIYDYTSFEHSNEIIELKREIDNYSDITIIAWSLGVWAAHRVLDKIIDLDKISRTISINSTLRPIDDNQGIPTLIFRNTILNIFTGGASKFTLRMCGKRDIYADFLKTAPDRGLESIHDELVALEQDILENQDSYNSDLKWDRAIISTNDNIFPYRNLSTFWESHIQNNTTQLTILEAPHYPFYLWSRWEDILECSANLNKSNQL